MRPAEEWLHSEYPDPLTFIRAVQADALESAAQIADVYDWEDANDRIRALKPEGT